MTEDQIRWHNELVQPDDIVYHLGDFTFGGTQEVIRLFRRLNGIYNLIDGNHDKPMKDFRSIIDHYPDLKPRINFLGPMAEVIIEGQSVVLNHYAMKVWNKSHRGTWHLYGHSHGTLPDDPNSMSFDVGADCHNYRPINFDRVKQIMSKKTYKPKDHHGSHERT
jgi:calcineurin-like phosphoesterase family protein